MVDRSRGATLMLTPKIERLEKKIKEINAIKSEYRAEIDEAFRRFKDKKIGKEDFERIRQRNEEKIEKLNEKIKEIRLLIKSMKES
jgi:predicted  nucleic acid-binding Zn-ribbon protein